jgi:PAS domain-containing protein
LANDRALRLYRAADLDELAGQTAIDYMEPSLRAEALNRMRSIEQRVQLGYVDEAIVRLDGTVCEIEAAASPILFGGHPAALVVMRDITARKAAEAARHAAEERFRSAFIHAPVGMAVVDTDGRVGEVNPALGRIVGRPTPELLGFEMWRWLHDDDRAESRERFNRLLQNASTVETSDIRFVRATTAASSGRRSPPPRCPTAVGEPPLSSCSCRT